nr:cyclin-dependent kinase inhibitor 1C-like [Penaeus vannamei]
MVSSVRKISVGPPPGTNKEKSKRLLPDSVEITPPGPLCAHSKPHKAFRTHGDKYRWMCHLQISDPVLLPIAQSGTRWHVRVHEGTAVADTALFRMKAQSAQRKFLKASANKAMAPATSPAVAPAPAATPTTAAASTPVAAPTPAPAVAPAAAPAPVPAAAPTAITSLQLLPHRSRKSKIQQGN